LIIIKLNSMTQGIDNDVSTSGEKPEKLPLSSSQLARKRAQEFRKLQAQRVPTLWRRLAEFQTGTGDQWNWARYSSPWVSDKMEAVDANPAKHLGTWR
jgi:hypothetical protein